MKQTRLFFSFPTLILGSVFVVLVTTLFVPTTALACSCVCVSKNETTKLFDTSKPIAGYPDEASCKTACVAAAAAFGPTPTSWTSTGFSCKDEAKAEAAKTEASKSTYVAPPTKPITAIATCECFCATSGGAMSKGKTKLLDCQSSCKKGGNQMAVCAYRLAQYPSKNLRCFNEKECKGQNGLLDTKQSQECVAGSRYCYPDPAKAEKLKLNVPIGGETIAIDLGQYINILYKWLMVAGVTFAIVMTMIGGLQYVISAGSGASSEGKKRITNGVTGLILLFCTYLILFTVNPYLVKLQVPKLPMIKTVILATGESCETMIKAGYTVEVEGSAEKKCGTIGKVTKAPGDKAVPDGSTCDFTKCSNAGEKCLGSGDKAKCLSCLSFVGTLTSPASSGVCSQLSIPDTTITVLDKSYTLSQKCGVTWAPQLVSSSVSAKITQLIKDAGDGNIASTVASGVQKNVLAECAISAVSCDLIKTCEDYSTKSWAKGKDKNHVLLGNVGTGLGDIDFKLTCQNNICKVPGTCVAETQGIVAAATTWSSLIPGVVLWNVAGGADKLKCTTH